MRSIFRTVVAPLQRFLEEEAASGVLLFVAAVAALLLANGPLADVYETAVHSSLPLPGRAIPIHAIVNDGLMALFFFLVGMEIKRELVAGELRSVSSAVLPGTAAAGGMLVPAAIYATLNPGGAAARGWAIPMATDIAFSIGCLTLLKKRVPAALVVFLTALAIFDDIGGIAAGVLLGLLVPASISGEAPLDRWIERLHGPVAFGIVPLLRVGKLRRPFTRRGNLGSSATGVAWRRARTLRRKAGGNHLVHLGRGEAANGAHAGRRDTASASRRRAHRRHRFHGGAVSRRSGVRAYHRQTPCA